MVTVQELLFATINGTIFGGLIMLTAVGLTLIFGVLDVPNFAQGEYAALSGYTTVALIGGVGLSLLPAALIALVVSFVAGVLTERLVIRPFYGERDFLIVSFFATFGLAISFEALLLILTGGSFYQIRGPDLGIVQVSGGQVSIFRVTEFGVVMLILVGLYLFTRYTYTGLAIRAVADEKQTARLLGVNQNRINSITFGLGALITGFTGILYGMTFNISPRMGTALTAFAFVVVVVGGIGSFAGAAVVSVLIGIVQNYTALFIGGRYRMFMVFVLMLLILIVNPSGLRGESA